MPYLRYTCLLAYSGVLCLLFYLSSSCVPSVAGFLDCLFVIAPSVFIKINVSKLYVCFYCNLQFLHNVIIIKTKVLLPQA